MFLTIKNIPKTSWSSKDALNLKPRFSTFFFLCFGSLVLSKNFVSLIALGLVILSLLFIKRNKYVIFGIIPYLTSLIYESVYTSEIKSWAHTDEINFESTRLESTFLEPACGDGNFLLEILFRKIKTVELRYKKIELDFLFEVKSKFFNFG